jgi:threonine dehydrogenase-like Zn-dependent dehydrogenase
MAEKNIDLSPLVTARFNVDDALGAVDAAQHPMSNIKAHIEFSGSF